LYPEAAAGHGRLVSTSADCGKRGHYQILDTRVGHTIQRDARLSECGCSEQTEGCDGNATNLHGFSSLRPEINLVGASIEICR
ncbi:hypothetical protein DD788_26570, partial [Ralstonia pickettii]|nr:hypothetical protein [Ralstonia pickettii]